MGHARYLSRAPTSVTARLETLGRRLNGAQAAQAKGSPEALQYASVQLLALEQSAFILAQNCRNYADLFEHVGFTVGERLDSIAGSLLDTLDRVESFKDAVSRLRHAA